jgi:hypothetical protein
MTGNRFNTGFLDYIYHVYNMKDGYELILAYEGEINQEIIKAFSSLAEVNLSKNDEPELLHKKVYHIMVEFLQNISRHAIFSTGKAYSDDVRNPGIVHVCRNHEAYFITTGNMIHKARKSELTRTLTHINSLSHEDLNNLYKNTLINGQISDKGGAGLGFIDIRRKTGSEISFRFIPASAENEFFLITTSIRRK